MQEILPKTVEPLASPADGGELSRRFWSKFAVQKTLPFKYGLDGNSRMWLFPTLGSAEFRRPEALTGFRKTSKVLPCLLIRAMAFRSFASTQMFPERSRMMPSPPSIIGLATTTLLR